MKIYFVKYNTILYTFCILYCCTTQTNVEPKTNLWNLVRLAQLAAEQAQETVVTVDKSLQDVTIKSNKIKLADLLNQITSFDTLPEDRLTDLINTITITNNALSCFDNSSLLSGIVSTIDQLDAVVTQEFNNVSISDAKLFSTLDSFEMTVAQKFDNIDNSDTILFSKFDTLKTQVAQEFNNVGISDAKLFSTLDSFEMTVAQKFDNIDNFDTILFSKFDTLKTQVAQEFNNVGISDAKLFSTLDSLEMTVAQKFNNIDNSDAKLFSKLDTLETHIVQEFNNVGISDAKLFSTLENIETTVAQEFGNIDNSGAKLFSKLDTLETHVVQEFNNVGISDAKLFSTLENIETTVAQEFGNIDNSGTKLFSKLDTLETHIVQEFNNVGISDAKLFSRLDGLEMQGAQEFAHAAAVQGTLLRKVNLIDTELSQGINLINTKLNTIEPLGPPFLISQQTIGSNVHFALTQPGYYKLTESIILNTGMAIQISANNIVLDLNGMSLDSSATSNGTSIFVGAVAGIIIKNGTVLGSQGIVLNNAYDVTIEDIIGFHNSAEAISLVNSHQIVIENCGASHNDLGSGFMVDEQSSEVIIKNCSATLCANHGFDLAGYNLCVINSMAQSNGGSGIFCHNIANVQLLNNSIQGNGIDGIFLDSTVADIQVISNRILANVGVGLHDTGATHSVCLNNLSTSNGQDYAGVKAVIISKATSYWHNVQG